MKAYGELNSEAELTNSQDRVPRIEWPDKGIIELQDVKFKYATNYPYVLKSITFKIHSGEKVRCYIIKMHTHYYNNYSLRLVL